MGEGEGETWCQGGIPAGILGFHLPFSQSIPAYSRLLHMSLDTTGTGPSLGKGTIKTKSSADAAAQRGSYIQDHRPRRQLSKCSSLGTDVQGDHSPTHRKCCRNHLLQMHFLGSHRISCLAFFRIKMTNVM